jgi:short-subunit dehydrogenase
MPAWDQRGQERMNGGAGGDSRIALITGASRGIGEAFAELLARQGYRLVIVARSESELNRVSGVLSSKHETAVVPIAFDLGEPGAGAGLADDLQRRGLTPTVIVNNAGYGLLGAAADMGLDDQLGMIDINVRALTELSLRFLPGLLAGQGRRGIINIASLASLLPGPNMAVYYATKAYVLSFSEALAQEVKDRGVTVTAVCPGVVPTGFQARAGMEHTRAYKLSPKVTAKDVALAGWGGFQRGDRVVYPGAATWLMAAALRMTPNAMLLPLVRQAFNLRKGP